MILLSTHLAAKLRKRQVQDGWYNNLLGRPSPIPEAAELCEVCYR
jgi:hypothetical protein